MSDGVGSGGRTASPEAGLAAVGLPVELAVARLSEVGLWHPEQGPRPGTRRLIGLLGEAAAVEDALHVVCDLALTAPDAFAAVRADDGWLQRLIAVAGVSRPLGDLLVRDRRALDGLAAPTSVEADVVADEVVQDLRGARADERARLVAAIRRRHTAAIAARDVTGRADLDQVLADLSALADGVLSGALRAVRDEYDEQPAARIAVVGMGKLGGEELNYVSDVDVVFVHEPVGDDGRRARRQANQICQDLLGVLNARTGTGRAYDMDATLRPEGPDGPLTRTVDSYTTYWRRWAETWEFQAMLKARPVAGDRDLGARLVAASQPFVFPDALDPEIVADIRDMKGRVEAKREVVVGGDRHLKLGPGGLRDVEFAVQLLQLVHGRADRRLRRGGTLAALRALVAGGYVADEDATRMGAAYRRLRAVEHRLQLADERRTHTLPDDPSRLDCLARGLGYRPEGQQPPREPFLRDLRRAQSVVRELHTKLFYRPLLKMHAAVPAGDADLADQTTGLDEQAAVTRLEALGFHDPTAVLRDVRALTSGVTRKARTLRAALPVMLHALSNSPDPDGGLRALRSLVEGVADDAALFAALRDLPPVADLLARLLGTSEVVGELLTTQPQGMGWLTEPDSRAEPRTREELVSRAFGLLRWQDAPKARRDALRRFKRRELARIVIRDLAGDAGEAVAGRELAALGEACLQAGLDVVVDEILREDDCDPEIAQTPARISLIGFGKLGGRELHYVSDLDVVFVHTARDGVDTSEANRFAVRVAERVLSSLSAVTAEGTAFEVDAELRPEGRSGPLSRSLASCRTYYDRWSQPWEHQALLRTRHVAGDEQLGAAFLELARHHAYPSDFDQSRASEIRKMKARIERERVPDRVDASQHLKLGPGGLSDIEWTVQLLQQRHGHDEPAVRTASTLAALDGLVDTGLVDIRDARWLGDAYRLLTRTRNQLYLLRARDVDVLPPSGPMSERLARALGYGRGRRQDFEDDYRRATRRVRQVTERLFYGQTE